MPTPPAIAAELLTEAECIRRIPGRSSEVRAWLRTLAGVRRRGPTGLILYPWHEVLSRLPLADEVAVEVPVERTAALPLRRATLVART
jgi:hypothetical protein